MVYGKDKPMFAIPAADAFPAANMAAMTERLGLSTTPAAWPSSASRLAFAIDVCQRCDATQVCRDWLLRAPQSIKAAPAFCPNAAEFARDKAVKERG